MKQYRAFLVRCWYEGAGVNQPQHWRFALTEIGGTPQQPRGLAGFDLLVKFLAAELSAATLQGQPPEARSQLSQDSDSLSEDETGDIPSC